MNTECKLFIEKTEFSDMIDSYYTEVTVISDEGTVLYST